MRRSLNLLIIVALFLVLPGAANAYTVTYSHLTNGNEYISPYVAVTEDFEGPLAWTWTGSSQVVQGSVSGKYAAPGGVDGVNQDQSHYVTVPHPNTNGSGSVTVTGLGAPGEKFNYFGIWWGSMDTYNTFIFYNEGAPVLTLTGASVAVGNANGNQVTPATNHYVNFLDLPFYDSFVLASSQFAFEADNISIAKDPSMVPIPGAFLLLGSGLIGLIGIRRRMRS